MDALSGRPTSFFDRGSCLSRNDLPMKPARLGHGLHAELSGQDALTVMILGHGRIGVTETDEIFHQRAMNTFPARVIG